MVHTAPVALEPAARLRRRGVLLVLVAGALYSSAGLFTRSLPLDAWTVLAWRSLFGALYMAAFVAVENRRLSLRDYVLQGPHLALVPITALGTICYIFALKLTSVADVMIVYATTPFVAAALGWMLSREAPGPRTIVASILALAGVAVMIGGGGPPSEGRLVGAGLTFTMNVTFALALVLARRRPDISMAPSNALGVLLASLVAFALSPGESLSLKEFGISAMFGVLTIGFALSLFMVGARVLPSAEVSLLGISDTVLGPVLVWLVFGENPGESAIAGGAMVIAALLWHLWPELRGLAGRRRPRN